MPRSHRRRAAFTLVELLVVIGIIALLISLLLPSLQRTRRAANTIACASNLRSILQAMHIYATQNNGAIPGSVWTTARFVYANPREETTLNRYPAGGPAISNTNCPDIFSVFDWASPLLKVMGVKFDEGHSEASRISRLELARKFRGFRCPENEIPANPFKSGGAPPPQYRTDVLVSYNTALGFLVQGTTGSNPGIAYMPSSYYVLPPGYNVTTTRVGQAASKIYIADGARFCDSTSANVPDYDIAFDGAYGGPFADQGAFSAFSRSWCRIMAPGNKQVGTRDPRIFAYRHGNQKQRGLTDSYKGNFGFFDGHVELLGDLQSANPAYWLPRGTRFPNNASTEMWPDVFKTYAGGNKSYVVP